MDTLASYCKTIVVFFFVIALLPNRNKYIWPFVALYSVFKGLAQCNVSIYSTKGLQYRFRLSFVWFPDKSLEHPGKYIFLSVFSEARHWSDLISALLPYAYERFQTVGELPWNCQSRWLHCLKETVWMSSKEFLRCMWWHGKILHTDTFLTFLYI